MQVCLCVVGEGVRGGRREESAVVGLSVLRHVQRILGVVKVTWCGRRMQGTAPEAYGAQEDAEFGRRGGVRRMAHPFLNAFGQCTAGKSTWSLVYASRGSVCFVL